MKMNDNRTIEKCLKALSLIKGKFVWVENGDLKSGQWANIEITLYEDEFESKEDYELVKEVFE